MNQRESPASAILEAIQVSVLETVSSTVTGRQEQDLHLTGPDQKR